MVAVQKRARPLLAGGAAAALVLGLTACAGSDAGGESTAAASDCGGFPDGDIEFVVPYSAGGGFDTWARLIAPELQERLGVSVPVVNREGAGGITGVTEVYGSKPDGQRIVITEPGILATTLLSGEVSTDFTSMVTLGRATVGPEVIVVKGDSPWNTIEDVQAEGRELLMGTGGLAAVNIISFDALGLPFTNVVHEGSSEALLSVIRGDTEIAIFPLGSVAEGVRGGDLKPLVVVGSEPGADNPDADVIEGVPTLDEVTGEDGLGAALEQHRMIVAPPGLSDCVVDTLADAITDTFESEEFQDLARDANLTPAHLGAAEAQEVFDGTFVTFERYQDLLAAQLEG